MAGFESILSEDPELKKRRLRMVVSILIGVVLLHVAAGVVAGIFIVARYIFPPPANFVVKKDIRLPAKKREHKMNMAALDAIAPKPTLSDKMQSTRPTAFSLPDVPDMPLDQMLPLDPSQLLADQMSSFSNSEALGAISGAGVAGGGGFGGKGVGFLGVNANGKRILLIIDVSQTVAQNARRAGIPFETIGEEVQKLVEGLPLTARFGILCFKRSFEAFRQELVPNGNTNRQAALPWIKQVFTEGKTRAGAGGNGLLDVLTYAKNNKPDLVFVVTDGSCQADSYPSGIPWSEVKKAVEAIQDENGKASQVNFIVFGPKENDLKELKKLADTNNFRLTVKK
jgi:hypothetical protein